MYFQHFYLTYAFYFSLVTRKPVGRGFDSDKWIKRPNRVFRALQVLHFRTSSERIARVASCIEPYFSLEIHAKPSFPSLGGAVHHHFNILRSGETLRPSENNLRPSAEICHFRSL